MNKITINTRQTVQNDASTLSLSYDNANKMLPILRSDHFKSIILQNVSEVDTKSFKFLIQLSRLLKAEGSIVLQGTENKDLTTLLSRLGLHQADKNAEETVFLKSKPKEQVVQNKKKLAIGFKSNEAEQEIDENELLEGQNIDLTKKKGQACSTKVRACANCSCGRKDAPTNISKEQLVKSINEGQPIAGCGKCSMGDSFRCGTCPYKGLPAFKPGDKLKLVQEGGVVVQSTSTKVSATGKVKLEL